MGATARTMTMPMHADRDTLREYLASNDGYCPECQCHYNLRGNTTGVCPECEWGINLYKLKRADGLACVYEPRCPKCKHSLVGFEPGQRCPRCEKPVREWMFEPFRDRAAPKNARWWLAAAWVPFTPFGVFSVAASTAASAVSAADPLWIVGAIFAWLISLPALGASVLFTFAIYAPKRSMWSAAIIAGLVLYGLSLLIVLSAFA